MGFCKDLISVANLRRNIYANAMMPRVFIMPNVVNGFCMPTPQLNFVPNIQTNCCTQGAAPTFIMPNNMGCNCNKNLYNLDFMANPINGNSNAVMAGFGIPDYFNGTFTPFNNAMAIPKVQQQAQTLAPEKMLNDLGKLILLKLLMDNMKNGLPLKQTDSGSTPVTVQKDTTPANNSQADRIAKLEAENTRMKKELEKANAGEGKGNGRKLDIDDAGSGENNHSDTGKLTGSNNDEVVDKNGNPVTGLVNGRYHFRGKIKSGLYNGIRYADDGYPLTGPYNGRYYNKGKVSSGTITIVRDKDDKPLTGENQEDGLYYENGVQKRLPKLTKKQIRDINDIFYGDKKEIKSKLEKINDDTLLAYLSDKNQIKKVFDHLFSGLDDTKTAGYLINRLSGKIPKDYDLYYQPLSFTPFVGRVSEKPAETYIPVKYSDKLDCIVNKNYSDGTWESPIHMTMWEGETRDAVYLLAREVIKYRYKQD